MNFRFDSFLLFSICSEEFVVSSFQAIPLEKYWIPVAASKKLEVVYRQNSILNV